MHRFYCQDADFSTTTIAITDPHEVHHIKDVLRLKKGACVQIFNGRSQEADIVLEDVLEGKIVGKIQSVREQSKALTRIILACAPPKKGKFETIIEKCTELGVDAIIPLKTKRGEVVFTDERMGSKLGRFQSVAINAAKQSKQMNVPDVVAMRPLPEVLKSLDPNGLALFPSLNGQSQHIREVLLKQGQVPSVTVFIGPEGDFTPDEVELAVKSGCIPVSLGSSVLKVETAAMASVALVRFLCRD